MKFWNKVLFSFIILLLLIYSIFVEPNRLEVNHFVIQDSELKGLKIVFASDFHIKLNQQKRLERVVKLINSENPDLVLSVGDFVSGHNEKMTMPIEDITKELSKIKSKYGVYVTLGNHDGWYGSERIVNSLEANKIKVISNNKVSVQVNNKIIYISGVEDLMTGKPLITKALEGVTSPVIFLTHSPDLFAEIPKGVNLILAGHTHGGQVRLPFWGPILTSSSYGDKYALGLVEENGKRILTTKGIGTSILPIRFNCIPEIVVIDFE